MSDSPFRLAVLISGGGRTLLNLHDRIVDESLNAKIDIVVATRADLPGVDRAKQRDLPLTVIDPRAYRNQELKTAEQFHHDLHRAVKNVDLVCMAGFLSLWRIPDDFTGRVINIHPALLPDFGGKGMYGQRVHEAVIASGKKISGCTVHLCDNQYDHGPIVLQREVPVLPDDTADALGERVFEQENIAYPEAVSLFVHDRVRIIDGQVEIARA